MRVGAWWWVLVLVAAPAAATGQDLSARITGGGDGTVRVRFPVRDGVEICRRGIRVFGSRMEWEGDRWSPDRCEKGPVTVELRVRRGEVRGVDVLLLDERGAEGARDLGTVEAARAVEAMLQAARGGEEDALLPVTLADVDGAWRDLLALAQDRRAARGVRKAALFWVGQEAAEAATGGLSGIARAEDEDQGVRDAAVFALSRRAPEESVPVLVELARTAEQAQTRRTAFFWLAQIDDPRVPAFFREVLASGG